MAKANLGTLRAFLELNSAKFSSTLIKADSNLKKFEIKMNQKLSFINKGLGSIASGIGKIALPATIAGGAIFALTKKTVDALDVFDKMSARTGLSTDNLQAMNFAASQVGSSLEAIENGAIKIQKSLFDADNGLSTATRSFDRLGLKIHNADGSLRSVDDIFPEMISKLQGMQNETERNAIAMELMGRGGKDLINILDTSAESWEALQKEAHDAGLIIEEESIKQAVEFKDKLDELSRQLTAASQRIGLEFIPIMEDLIPILEEDIVPLIGDFAKGLRLVSDIWSGQNRTAKKIKENLVQLKPLGKNLMTFAHNAQILRKAIMFKGTPFWDKWLSQLKPLNSHVETLSKKTKKVAEGTGDAEISVRRLTKAQQDNKVQGIIQARGMENLMASGVVPLQAGYAGLTDRMLQFSEITDTWAVDLPSTISAFSDTLQNAVIAGGANLKEFGDIVVLQARQFVRAKIAEGVTAYVASALSTIPFPFGILAAGLAGSAATALFNTVVPGFASGAIVTGPMIAQVGENGTEVIFPLDKLSRFLGSGANTANINVTGLIEGENIRLVKQRTDKFRRKFA